MTAPSDIMADVLRAMQDAEEIGGPEGAEYVTLMLDIAGEAIKRAQNCASTMKITSAPKRETERVLRQCNQVSAAIEAKWGGKS